MNYQCRCCHIKAFEDKVQGIPFSKESKHSLIKAFYTYMSDHGLSKSSPEAARDIQAMIRQASHLTDPYKKEKELINKDLLNLYPELKKKVEQSKNPLDEALRLSIAGNIIDSVASPDYNIQSTINYVLSSEFKIDHSDSLFREMKEAKSILYLGDNAGEIVLDKLFIETLGYSNIIYAVRGAPVLNDATIIDAEQVGINESARVISNGTDAPSTLMDRVSEEFRLVYDSADIIISKGQGNLEGLIHEKSKNIYFLLMVKCNVIGEIIGAAKGDFVVVKNATIQDPALTMKT